jgi:ribosomal protein S18 acetylase RimI-like enzyme
MSAVAQAGSVSESGLEVRSTRDRELLLEFLARDRLTAAYAICDLDDREFPRTRWGVALDGASPVAVALEYTGLSPQPLFVMGEGDGVTAVLRTVIKPRTAYLASTTSLLQAVDPVYRIEPGPPMIRMWVDRASFRPAHGLAVRLTVADIGELNRLYDLGLTSWLPSESVARGVYYGVRVGGKLVAAAGTHVITRDQRLAAVGNVLTHREYRNRGYAKIATTAVTEELLRFCDEVVLNVRSDNPPALAAYRSLGYREHTTFEERLVHRRGTLWDSITLPFRRFMPAYRRSE